MASRRITHPGRMTGVHWRAKHIGNCLRAHTTDAPVNAVAGIGVVLAKRAIVAIGVIALTGCGVTDASDVALILGRTGDCGSRQFTSAFHACAGTIAQVSVVVAWLAFVAFRIGTQSGINVALARTVAGIERPAHYGCRRLTADPVFAPADSVTCVAVVIAQFPLVGYRC